MRRAACVLALLAAGCGAPSKDLFQVTRSGADRNANLELVVNDSGTVTCGRGGPRALPGRRLLEARDLARDLEAEATLFIDLPPERNSILRYVVRTQAGRVAFSDTSRDRPGAFDRLAAFTKRVAEDVCGISR